MTREIVTITELADAYASLADQKPTGDQLRLHEEAWRDAGAWYRQTASEIIVFEALQVTVWHGVQPYISAAVMAREVRRTGGIGVSADYCDHPFWDAWTNMAYRLVHDIVGHMALGGRLNVPAEEVPAWDVAGEIAAWREQLDFMRRHGAPQDVVDVSFCEHMGQLAYAAVEGDFHPLQPCGFLPFDPGVTIVDDRKGVNYV